MTSVPGGRTSSCLRFFFQAEDGIRDDLVTGVQTCALPIWRRGQPVLRQCARRRYDCRDPRAGRVQSGPRTGVVAEQAMSARLRVVIADDERPARSFLAALLRTFEDVVIVAEAESGTEAVEIIEREKPDMAFLDLQM